MDEILSKRPNSQLENVNIHVKTYIQLLEKQLRSSIALTDLHKEIGSKYLTAQEELRSVKLQRNEHCQQVYEIQKLKAENTNLGKENIQLKQSIIMLQTEIMKLKKNIKTDETYSNKRAIYPPQLINGTNNDQDANSILVKGFMEQQLNAIPKINIINLGNLMNIKVLDQDILKISRMERKFYERHNLKPDKLILVVQFRTPELKVEFLKNKGKLKLHSDLVDIEMSDYVSDEVYNLYQYAKILKTCGYALIYWRNNCVYAKKTRSTLCEPILIKSKNDVDMLKVVKN